jgi:cytochrome b pre-mRNA-processing protein 3
MGMTPQGREPFVSRPTPPARWIARLLLVVLVVGLAWWLLRSTARPTRQALLELPIAERTAMFRRALDDLAVCEERHDPRLATTCRDRAEFLLLFPECDGACRDRTAPFLASPTR